MKHNYTLVIIALIIIILQSCSTKKSNPIKAEIDKTQYLKEFIIADITTGEIAEDYRQHYTAGMDLALNEINSRGGINKVPLKVISYNDYGNYIDAYNAAKKAEIKDKAIILTGTFLPQTAKGVALYAKEKQIPFIATGSPTEGLFKENIKSDFAFRLRSGVDLNIEALATIIKNTKIPYFAVVTYSNEEGEYISNKIKETIKSKNQKIKFAPDIKVSQFATFGQKISDETYNTYAKGIIIAVNGPDIQRLALLLEKTKATLHKEVYILYAGEPEWLDSLGEFTPKNWITTGFPWYNLNNNLNKEFYKKYQEKYKSKPRYASYLGYINIYLIANALKQANITNNNLENKLLLKNALKTAKFNSPIGEIRFQENNQSNIGTYVGTLKPFNKTKQIANKSHLILDLRMFNSIYVENAASKESATPLSNTKPTK